MSADCLTTMLEELRATRPHAISLHPWMLACADVISAMPERSQRWDACCAVRDDLKAAIPGLSPELAMLEILQAVMQAGGRT